MKTHSGCDCRDCLSAVKAQNKSIIVFALALLATGAGFYLVRLWN